MKQRKIVEIKGREVINVLVNKLHYQSKNGKGDHVNIKAPNGSVLTVSRSKMLPIGILNDVIKRAGLNKNKFLELL